MKYTSISNKATQLKDELISEIKAITTDFPISYNLIDKVATFKSTKIYGNCKYVRGLYQIAVNENLLSRANDHDIKEVILHELIHTMPNCFNHKWQFKNKAWKYQRITGYDALNKHYPNVLDRPTKNLTYVCTKCGKEFHRVRRINTSNRVCGSCRGKIELKET